MQEDLIKNISNMEDRRVFTEKEEAAMIVMYEIVYPIEFQDKAELSVDEIIALKAKHLRLLDEAQQLTPLVANILSLPAIPVLVESEETDYV